MIIAGLDVGTTGCKLSVYQEDGKHIKTEYREYDVTGRSDEMDALQILQAVEQVISSVCAECSIDVLGVTTFGETFVLLDKQDRVLLPLMLYTNPCGEKQAAALDNERTARTVGAKASYTYSLPKIAWVRQNRPDVFSKVHRIMLMQDYIVYNLTGCAQIDYTMAARTMGFDITALRWDQSLLRMVGVDPIMLSKPVPTGTEAGRSNRFGLKNTLVVSGCHDQIASLLGAGITEPGFAADGIGTVECITPVFSGVPSCMDFFADGYAAIPYLKKNQSATYGYNFSGGATLKWFRNNFYRVPYAEADALVDPSEPSGLLVLPHFGGAATPYMNGSAKGAIVGLDFNTTRERLYQAMMEGTTYEMLLNAEKLKQYGVTFRALTATGGGAKSAKWLQCKANIMNVPILTIEADEVGAVGTAMLAGKAAGVFSNLDEAKAVFVRPGKLYEPDKSAVPRFREVYERYVRMYPHISEI